MSQLKGFANVIYPTRDLRASVAAWSRLLGEPPAFEGDDIAVFTGNGVELGLSSAPWVNHPLVFWKVDDIDQAHREMVGRGAIPMAEMADGSLAELGAVTVANGDPETGIVTVPGGKLAVLKAPDGSLLALNEETG